ERHLAISNTPVARETTSGGEKTVEFRQTRPLPSYLLAIATGPLDTVSVPGMSVPARIVAVKGAGAMTAEAVRMTPPILSALEKYFGRPYPYEKLDQIAVPEFWPGAMENAGAVTYADRILLMDPRAVSVQQRRRLAEVMAHELSHMGFGDHEWGSAEASDLSQALSKAAGKDVGSAMATFLDQPGVPLVSAEPLAGGRVRLRQHRFLNYGTPAPPPTLWQIPVTLRFSDGKKTYTQSLLLTDSVRTVTLHPAVRPTWLH